MRSQLARQTDEESWGEMIGEAIGAAAGLAAVAGVGLSLSPKVRARRDRAARRNRDLDGVPPRIENGVVVEPGVPSLAAGVHNLAELVAALSANVQALGRELRPNGGESLRDRVDQVHALTVGNDDRYQEVIRLAAEAARVAAVNDQNIVELRQEDRERHEENRRRLDSLEERDRDLKVQREFLLQLLRERHGIDLLEGDH